MIFIYDIIKDERNKEKDKISFEEAQRIWNDPNLIVLPAKRRGEKRKLAIGRYYAITLSVIFTEREKAIRIISARRATTKEVKYYDQHKDKK